MSLVNIAQMIEKELQRLDPHTLWRDKTSESVKPKNYLFLAIV